MKEIQTREITRAIRELCIQANWSLPEDVEACIRRCAAGESWPAAKAQMDTIIRNIDIAREEQVPLCQDTGMACVFLELGQEVHIAGGNLSDAVNEGVRQGYVEGFLRKSIVRDPLRRENTKDNTPALLHVDVVPGDKLAVTVAPKGIGSENMSRMAMLKPSDGEAGVRAFVVDVVRQAGPNPCPPIVVGVGIGGSFDRAPLLAKKALLRPLDQPHPDPFYRELEEALLEEINSLGIGPQGFGGDTTALKVCIQAHPAHIAGLPVAVNINCHVARHACALL